MHRDICSLNSVTKESRDKQIDLDYLSNYIHLKAQNSWGEALKSPLGNKLHGLNIVKLWFCSIKMKTKRKPLLNRKLLKLKRNKCGIR